MMIARLLVSYQLTDTKQGGTIGIDIKDYDNLCANDILDAILDEINDIYQYDVKDRIRLANVVELQPRRQSASQLQTNYRTGCMVCGQQHGHSGLPCPTMTPMA